MSLAISQAMGYIRSKFEDAEVTNVGATVFIRNIDAESALALDGDEVSGRVLCVDTENDLTEAVVVKLRR